MAGNKATVLALKEKVGFVFLLGALVVISFFIVLNHITEDEEDLLYSALLVSKGGTQRIENKDVYFNIDSAFRKTSINIYKRVYGKEDIFFGQEERIIIEKNPDTVTVIKKDKKQEEQKIVLNFAGTMKMGNRDFVVIENITTGETRFVKDGDIVEGYKVEIISEKIIKLVKNEKQIELVLDDKESQDE